MKWRLSLPVLVLVVGVTAAGRADADGPCRLCSPTSSAEVAAAPKLPVAIEVETSLDFDKLIVTGPGTGVARLLPDGAKSTSGALDGLRGRSMVGTVVIRGEPGRAVQVDLPATIELYGAQGGQILVRRLASDLPVEPRLDSTGRLIFRFGGELQVNGDADGDYRGEVPITVQYL